MPMSAVASSPVSISGPSSQKVALSISTRSRTTSQSSSARARRCSRLLGEPTAGFSPKRKYPFTVPSSIPSMCWKAEWSPVMRGRWSKQKSFSAVAWSPHHALSRLTR